MTANVLDISGEFFGIVVGAVILVAFAVTLAVEHRTRTPPGSQGYREGTTDHEDIRPDAYIDSFASIIEEAGGLLPPILYVFIPGILLWWLVYLIVMWE